MKWSSVSLLGFSEPKLTRFLQLSSGGGWCRCCWCYRQIRKSENDLSFWSFFFALDKILNASILCYLGEMWPLEIFGSWISWSFFSKVKILWDCTKIPKVPNPKSTQPKVPNLPFSPNLYSTYKRMNFWNDIRSILTQSNSILHLQLNPI